MEPSVVLTNPYTEPANTFRAGSVTEMFSLASQNSAINGIYDVGRPSSLSNRFAVRNNTYSHPLKVEVSLPPYLQTGHSLSFVINPTDTVRFTVEANESYLKSFVGTRQPSTSGNVSFTIYPLNVNGPVYVMKGLPALTA